MSQIQSQNPYASPSQLGVRPDCRAVGRVPQPGVRLDVRRAAADRGGRVRRPGQPDAARTAARSWYLPVLIVQIVLVFAISGAINS